MFSADDGHMDASDALLDAYEAALGDLAGLSNRAETRRELWMVIQETMVTELRFIRGDQDIEASVSVNGTVCEPFSSRLVDRLLLDPEKADHFLTRLTQDLHKFLSEGGYFGGSWGCLRARGEDLVGLLTVRETVAFERSSKNTLMIDLGD